MDGSHDPLVSPVVVRNGAGSHGGGARGPIGAPSSPVGVLVVAVLLAKGKRLCQPPPHPVALLVQHGPQPALLNCRALVLLLDGRLPRSGVSPVCGGVPRRAHHVPGVHHHVSAVHGRRDVPSLGEPRVHHRRHHRRRVAHVVLLLLHRRRRSHGHAGRCWEVGDVFVAGRGGGWGAAAFSGFLFRLFLARDGASSRHFDGEFSVQGRSVCV